MTEGFLPNIQTIVGKEAVCRWENHIPHCRSVLELACFRCLHCHCMSGFIFMCLSIYNSDELELQIAYPDKRCVKCSDDC